MRIVSFSVTSSEKAQDNYSDSWVSELYYFLKVTKATFSLRSLLSCSMPLEVPNLSAFPGVHIRLLNPPQENLG